MTTAGDDTGSPSASDFDQEIRAALADIGVLLEFLGRADDGRLQFYFKDTRGEIAGVVSKHTSPPCRNYADFLTRLVRIRAAAATNNAPICFDLSANLQRSANPQQGDDPQISDLAFLLWTRDFLAAVAAPATADSIRLTEKYMESRTVSLLQRLIKNVTAYLPKKDSNVVEHGKKQSDAAAYQERNPIPPTTISHHIEQLASRHAEQLATRITLLNCCAVFITLVTLIVSIYALSGQEILSARDDTIKAFSDINAKIFDIETHSPQPAAATQPAAAAQPAAAPFVFLCDTILPSNPDQPPSFGPIPNKASHYTYIAYEVIDNCRHYRKTLTQLFAIGEQLISWEREVTRFRQFHGIFGRSDATIEELSANEYLCADFAGIKSPLACDRNLTEIVEYYGRIPEAILGCIVLYILPCLYGFIGASAATMRYLRTKADTYLLNFTDRSRILQNVVLGIVAGAVIGLFFAYIKKASTIEGIGVSALAFLAGYNVTGLFALFDEISNRIFGASASHIKPNS